MPLYLLDTNVCIEILRGLPAAGRLPPAGECALSAITAAELWSGAEKSDQREKQLIKVETFIKLFAQLPFEDAAARRYAEIRSHLERKGTQIGPLDQLIAAHALSLNAGLVTGNLREFQRVPGLKCVAWRRNLP